ncbi:hypothetical protein VTJ49DRAFT_6758 [Mycothermus thermophilus]|uniref:Ubiquinone biosynthesis O-methyltransferase, mitochondrial n=1 Tax=Humicola insolens TaxID=85995 RepID=A0ABR3VJ90_HUMIN
MRPALRHLPRRAVRPTPPAPRPTLTAPLPSKSRPFTSTPPHNHNHTPSSASVNETEISHFSALASSWWDPHGPSRPLHLMNPLRHDFIQRCLSTSPESTPSSFKLRYLDVGCGGGIFAESAARLPSTQSVTAIDPSPTILAVAREHARRDPALVGSKGRLTYVNTTIEELPLPEERSDRYDVVTLFEVLEHVDYPAAFLDRVGEFVRPGGWLVLSTIARTWMSWFTTKLVAEDVLGMVPRGTHDWEKYVNEDELRGYFAKKGGQWGAPRVMGVVYVPGVGWREVTGSERIGNYFFGVQRLS